MAVVQNAAELRYQIWKELVIPGVALTRVPGQIESAMWMSILALQALPYVAALACTALSRMPERSAAASAAGEREALPAGAG